MKLTNFGTCVLARDYNNVLAFSAAQLVTGQHVCPNCLCSSAHHRCWAWQQSRPQTPLAEHAENKSQILHDLCLNSLLGTAAFALQVAQLSCMGFTNEQGMLCVLGKVGRDFEAVLEL